jgi:hypothetical protein
MQMKLLGITNVDFDVTHQIFHIHQILGGGDNGTVRQLFIDFKKDYDLVRRKVSYNILIEFGTPRKLTGLIKMHLNETYSIARISKKSVCQVSYLECPETRRCFITIVFKLCFGIRH